MSKKERVDCGHLIGKSSRIYSWEGKTICERCYRKKPSWLNSVIKINQEKK